MKFRILFLLAFALCSFAQQKAPSSGLDSAAMNKSADPCVDFYQYACGGWLTANPLPADRSRWARFTELSQHNEKVLLDILQGAAVQTANRKALDTKIGDAYAACMNTAAINKRGLAPIRPELDHILAMQNKADVVAEIARLHGMGVPALFLFGSRPDAKDSTRTIAILGQGGLSLPDREYYLKTDPKSVDIRKHFVEHMTKMFTLAGDTAENAAKHAQSVLDLETILAKDSMDRVSLRDPNKTYHLMTRAELSALVPSFPWDDYFKATGAPAFDKVNVSQPDFFKQIPTDLAGQSIDAWRSYLGFHLLHTFAAELPDTFEQADFDFWTRYLTGAKEERPRNARCVATVDRTLGDLLGQKYVELTFTPDAKRQITELVDALEKAMGEDIRSLPWMSETTKKAALEKLAAITNNVGTPDKWRDYSKVTISRDDYLGNTIRAAQAAHERMLSRIGQPTDRSEWTMTTPTVNAFYNPPSNSINFPAGILQPPFFDPRRDKAYNFGAVGAVIGHEMTHGFDDQGRKYDAQGNVRDWWTPADAAQFEKRAACIADEYSGFTAVDDVKLNGRLTLGENSADNGGIRIALMALKDVLAGKTDKVDGLTPEQRFFIGYAQIWCDQASAEERRNRAMTDPHSPGQYRTNGVLKNMPEFQQAFSCKAGQPMVSDNACRVW
jgi:putative endopeptidase